MKAFFKDTDKLIVNSMTYDEALVGKMFLDKSEGKTIRAEQRNDINDDFDGLVLTIGGVAPTEEEIEARINAAVVKAIEEVEKARIKEVTIDLDKETPEVSSTTVEFLIADKDNLEAVQTLLDCVLSYGTPILKILSNEEQLDTEIVTYGFEKSADERIPYVSFSAEVNQQTISCEFAGDADPIVTITREQI